MPIDRIYVATHKRDMRLTRICVASIRYWYPEIPIYLLKDYLSGDFSTRDIEDEWNVRVYPTEGARFGWGFIKLEPLFGKDDCRFLVLDSDIVIVGRLLEALDDYSEDLVVHQQVQSEQDNDRLYFNVSKLMAFDPTFQFDGRTFNSGQWVGSTRKFNRNDFNKIIEWEEPRRLANPSVFRNEQGAFNYVSQKLAAANRLTIAHYPMMIWAFQEAEALDLRKIRQNSPYPQLIHWAGQKQFLLRHMPRHDVLQLFEDHYYSRIKYASLNRTLRLVGGMVEEGLWRLHWKLKQHRRAHRLHSSG